MLIFLTIQILYESSCFAGLEWHPRIRNERNHFIYNDLPRFIMDSYEECRDPPRLHVLDKYHFLFHKFCFSFLKRQLWPRDEV